jgi:glucose-1-phosphate thymidylyltransferase
VKSVRDPHRFGIVEIQNGFVSRLIEKPDYPPTDLAIVGINYFKNGKLLMDCLQYIIKKDIKTKGEYQITDAFQEMINRGEKIRTFLVDGWYDCGKLETLLQTNRFLLDNNSRKHNVPGSIIIPPVFIAPSSIIENSVVGPYVSVAEGSVISNAIVKDTIINRNAVVKNILLQESLIGDKASVNGMMHKLNVGDSSEVDFS